MQICKQSDLMRLSCCPGVPWSEKELALLKDAVPEHTRDDGTVKWAAVAACLPGRTDNEAARQYSRTSAKYVQH